jgi:hypothetical protein
MENRKARNTRAEADRKRALLAAMSIIGVSLGVTKTIPQDEKTVITNAAFQAHISVKGNKQGQFKGEGGSKSGGAPKSGVAPSPPNVGIKPPPSFGGNKQPLGGTTTIGTPPPGSRLPPTR